MSTATSVASRSCFEHQSTDTSVSDLAEQAHSSRLSMISRASVSPKKLQREVRFGAYVLGSTLGEGEFGKVKLGWRKDGQHPGQVAIKLIKRDTIVKDSESEIKIYREINSLRMLNHPNIVNLVEVLKSGKYIGIVLEYASGGELFDFILKYKYLKENVAKKLFAQLVSGVDYMHSKGLIHRDLKLENLLLDKHKNIIISDFGFVNSYNRAKNDLMKTSCGSPCYAAPELVLTQSPYAGRKVDIWSLGVILYAMLAGYLPFDDDADNEDGADIVKLYNYICRNPLTFPEYISPLARDLLRKIIVPNPAKRITMDEIKNHPWLASHINLLSIRQKEWDKVVIEGKERQSSTRMAETQKQKRYSMFNETTNSSALIMNSAKTHYGRTYTSNSNIAYANPTTMSSFANVVALPHESALKPSAPIKSSTSAQNLVSGENTDGNVSPTKLAQTPYSRGHTKSTSISGTYPSASNSLKAIVSERDKPAQFDHKLSPTVSPQGESSRVPAFTGKISTIAESPIQARFDMSAGKPAKSLVPTSERLPPAQRKPRPTSYHPSSMTSSLNVMNTSPATVLEYVKINPPANYSAPQFLSTSPVMNLSRAESVATTYETPSSPGSSSNFTTRSPNRRDSAVTPINVNGVLACELNNTENKRNSVLSYLEDKMDTLELTESHSPVRSPIDDHALPNIPKLPKLDTSLCAIETPKINHSPTFAVPTDSPIMAPSQSVDTINTVRTEKVAHVAENHEKAKTGRLSDTPRQRECSKENKDVRENKKKNRFSILSFYGTSNSSSNSISTLSKKALEPSNEANRSSLQGQRDHKLIDPTSSDPASSNRKYAGTMSSNNTQANGREASAARKVMNFFKRKSVRIG